MSDRSIRARRLARAARPEQLVMTLGYLSERDGAQLDLVAEYGVETLLVASITTAPEGVLL